MNRLSRTGIYSAAAVLAFAGASAAGSASFHSSLGSLPGRPVRPSVIQKGQPPLNWTRFPLSLPKNTALFGISAGGNGAAMWFTNATNNTLNALPLGGGRILSYPLKPVVHGTAHTFVPAYLTTGSNGHLYMTGCLKINNTCDARYLVAATTSGRLTAYNTPASGTYDGRSRLALGPDNNVWFPDGLFVAKLTPQGKLTEYPLPNAQNTTGDIATGADGRLWFDVTSGSYGLAVDAIDPSTGVVTSYPIQGSLGVFCTNLTGLASGNDGRVYVDCINGSAPFYYPYYLVGTAPDGSQIFVPDVPGAGTLARGPDGAVWFETGDSPSFSSPPPFPLLGRFDPLAGTITTYQAPFSLGALSSLAPGPDGNVWAVDNGTTPAIDVYIRNVLTVSPSHLSLGVGGNATLYATYSGYASLSATSSNLNVATVARGSRPRTFVVTATGSGTAIVTVSDPVENSFNVSVNVSARAQSRRGRVRIAATTTQWKQYPANVAHPSALVGIVSGPDGALWYTESQDNLLVRMSTTGSTILYKLSAVVAGHTYNFSPGFLAVGADHRFYLGGCLLISNKCQPYVGAATTGGKLAAYAVPSGDSPGFTNRPGLGPDSNVWVTESSHVAKIATSGTITEFAYPNGMKQGYGYPGVATGPDKNVWFDLPPSNVAKIVPSTGAITAYKVADPYYCSAALNDIAVATDGMLYLGCGSAGYSGASAGGVIQVTTAGAFTYFGGGWGPSYGTITGPDGRAWLFANHIPFLEGFGEGVIQQFAGGLGATTTYIPLPLGPSSPGPNFAAIATGPDGNIWALDTRGFVDVLVRGGSQ